MKELTLILDDEALYSAIEGEANSTGHTVQDVIILALQQWLADTEMGVEEDVELQGARREWKEKGGIEAHEFFDLLRDEESHLDR